jgi:multidrug resistance efflux pump
MKKKYILTGLVVLIALLFVFAKNWDYITNPWTRNGQVRANIIQITPRVSGPIISLPINDNQFVKKGDLLFQIDPETFEVELAQAKARLDATGYNYTSLGKQVENSKATLEASQEVIYQVKSSMEQIESQLRTNKREFDRQKALLPNGATSQKEYDKSRTAYEVSLQQSISAKASLSQAEATVRASEAALGKARASLGEIGKDNAQLREALAAVRKAELNLEFTKVKAPVDGFVTNLTLRYGSNTVANQPALALVDVNSYWIDGFFRENSIEDIMPGNQAEVVLMTYNDVSIKGTVESIGWGISQQDGTAGYQLLPNINPTFEWIRLAQRIPVKIKLTDVPDKVKLRVGTTCSVLVKTGTSKNNN